jgi:hypothetical protein
MSAAYQYITIRANDAAKATRDFAFGQFWAGRNNQPTATQSHNLWGAIPPAVQLVQDTIGVPVRINSTVRFPGGSKYGNGKSQHDYQNARAVDIGLPASKTAQVYKDILGRGPLFRALFAMGARGFGLYDTFIHVDFRTTGGSQQYNGQSFAFWDERVSNKPPLDLALDLTTPMEQPNEDDRSPAQKTGERLAFIAWWIVVPSFFLFAIILVRKTLRRS